MWATSRKVPGSHGVEKRKRRSGKMDKTRQYQQLYLDLGQSNVGETRCSLCRMVYAQGVEEDVRLHKQYHDKFVTKALLPRFSTSSADARIVQTFEEAHIVHLSCPVIDKALSRQLQAIEIALDSDIKASQTSAALSQLQQEQEQKDENHPSTDFLCVLLYVLTTKEVTAIALAEKISKAHPTHIKPRQDVVEIGTASVPSILGIRRLVLAKDACGRDPSETVVRLLNAACSHSIYGIRVPKAMCAFAPQRNSQSLYAAAIHLMHSTEDPGDPSSPLSIPMYLP